MTLGSVDQLHYKTIFIQLPFPFFFLYVKFQSIGSLLSYMFTMETTNPTHFQLYIQITHYADISQYFTGSHMSRSVIVPEVT